MYLFVDLPVFTKDKPELSILTHTLLLLNQGQTYIWKWNDGCCQQSAFKVQDKGIFSRQHSECRAELEIDCFFFSQLLEYDKELSVFKDRLHELEISFPPRYGPITRNTPWSVTLLMTTMLHYCPMFCYCPTFSQWCQVPNFPGFKHPEMLKCDIEQV